MNTNNSLLYLLKNRDGRGEKLRGIQRPLGNGEGKSLREAEGCWKSQKMSSEWSILIIFTYKIINLFIQAIHKQGKAHISEYHQLFPPYPLKVPSMYNKLFIQWPLILMILWSYICSYITHKITVSHCKSHQLYHLPTFTGLMVYFKKWDSPPITYYSQASS